LAKADFARFSQGLANNDIALSSMLISDAEKVRPLEVARVDVAGTHEASEINGLLGFQL
jgi:hypothetical protein